MSETQTQRRCSGGGKSILSGDAGCARGGSPCQTTDDPARTETQQVVLPLLDGPTMAQVVPAARENEISLRTVSGPAPV